MSDAVETTMPPAEQQVEGPASEHGQDPPPVISKAEDHGQQSQNGGGESSGSASMEDKALPPLNRDDRAVQVSPSESKPVPSVRKRKLKGPPKGILKPAPPPQKAFSFRRDILQQLNSRLAQQGVNVQVPVPPNGSFGSLGGNTAQAAGSLIGGMFKRIGGFATGALDESSAGAPMSGQRSFSSSGAPRPVTVSVDGQRLPAPQRAASYNAMPAEANSVSSSIFANSLPPPSSSARPIRKVRFTVSSMTVTYPISGAIAPGDEDATRIRIEREHRESMRKRKEQPWTVAELEKLYRECCRTREEHPLKKMRAIFQVSSTLVTFFPIEGERGI